MKGNSSMCDPQQKATKGHLSFIFGMNYTFLSFLITTLNLASNKWICIPWAYESDAWVMSTGANWNEALQNFEKTVQSSPSSRKLGDSMSCWFPAHVQACVCYADHIYLHTVITCFFLRLKETDTVLCMDTQGKVLL